MTDKESLEQADKELTELCKKYGCVVEAVPQFKLRDDGTYSIIARVQIVKIPQPTE